MRGIVLAGGCATGLWPAAPALPKSLFPVYDKPMIYHPLSLLLLAGIRHILIVSTPRATPRFQQLLDGGEQWGINLSYAIQPSAGAPVRAFIIASEFTGDQPVSLVPGDHVFYGQSLPAILQSAAMLKKGARLFARRTDRPQRCGMVSLDENGSPVKLEANPAHPAAGYGVSGLCFYDNTVAERARALALAPSQDSRYALTMLNNTYLADGALEVVVLDDGVTWLDVDTHDALREAGESVKAVEKNHGVKTGCPEEVAWRMGFIGDEQLQKLADAAGETPYGRYLRQLPEGGNSARNSIVTAG